ncbi:MAG: hypothetical protein ACTHLY_13635 [Pseudolabrys sp.]
MTSFTTMSACMNMPQGLRSRGKAASTWDGTSDGDTGAAASPGAGADGAGVAFDAALGDVAPGAAVVGAAADGVAAVEDAGDGCSVEGNWEGSCDGRLGDVADGVGLVAAGGATGAGEVVAPGAVWPTAAVTRTIVIAAPASVR